MPLAVLGMDLDWGGSAYLRRLYALTEATLALAVAYGLARVRHAGRSVPATLLTHLERPSLGARAQMIQGLEHVMPGACGWDFSKRSARFRALLQKRGVERKRRDPKISEFLSVICQLRNVTAHPGSAHSFDGDLAESLEEATRELIESNALFGPSLFCVRGFAETSDGRPGVTLTALSGLGAGTYARGKAVPLSGHGWEQKGRLVLLVGDQLVPLEPFLRTDPADVPRVSLLSALPATGPAVLWQPHHATTSTDGEVRAALQSMVQEEGRAAAPSAGQFPVGRALATVFALLLMGLVGWAVTRPAEGPTVPVRPVGPVAAPTQSKPARVPGHTQTTRRAEPAPAPVVPARSLQQIVDDPRESDLPTHFTWVLERGAGVNANVNCGEDARRAARNAIRHLKASIGFQCSALRCSGLLTPSQLTLFAEPLGTGGVRLTGYWRGAPGAANPGDLGRYQRGECGSTIHYAR